MARSSSNEEIINHFGAVRLRVTGSASLRLKFLSLDESKQFALKPLTLLARTDIEPNRISNFTQQRAKLEIRTTEINETFSISKIVIFTRPVGKSLPEK